MSDFAVVFLAALLVALGIVGILVPVVPGGSLLVGAGFLLWGWHEGGHAWIWFGVAAAVLAVGAIAKWVLPQRSLKARGVPLSTQLVGAALAVVGFFVVPVVGLFLGFIVGVWLAEIRRLGPSNSLDSTWTAIRAALWSIGIELTAAVVATVVWLTGVLVTAWV